MHMYSSNMASHQVSRLLHYSGITRIQCLSCIYQLCHPATVVRYFFCFIRCELSSRSTPLHNMHEYTYILLQYPKRATVFCRYNGFNINSTSLKLIHTYDNKIRHFHLKMDSKIIYALPIQCLLSIA